jgi:DNA-directed RNA polymerase specialized sigma24 family protein
MRSGAEEEIPAVAGGDTRLRDIQLAEGGDAEAEDLPPDERLDRMLGDRDLLLRLQLSGYAPRYWDPAAAEFARYGHDVLVGWLRKGKMLTKVYEKTKRRPRPPDDPFDEDAVQTLATDTVVVALDAFLEKVLKPNKWHPDGGASLKTFFIGQCCFQFTNAYKKWWRSEKHYHKSRDAADLLSNQKISARVPEPDFRVIQGDEIADALGLLSTDVARNAFTMHAAGYSHGEIAEHLELADQKAVENLLSYQRRRIAKVTTGGRTQ